jgi:hypothetical protein
VECAVAEIPVIIRDIYYIILFITTSFLLSLLSRRLVYVSIASDCNERGGCERRK